MSALGNAAVEPAELVKPSDLREVFELHYVRIARAITRVLRDPARGEEIAVEVFLKWSRTSAAHGEQTGAWLYRVAIRMALDELRRQERRVRYERLADFVRGVPNPEEVRASNEDQAKVRSVLSRLPKGQAALLLLRHAGFSYDELASALSLHVSSVGTLLSRAQKGFRREYVKRHGEK